MLSPELEAEYGRRKIGVIAPGAGVDALLRELIWGERLDAQVVYACAEAKSLEGDASFSAPERRSAVGAK
jgi:hypothetical protein